MHVLFVSFVSLVVVGGGGVAVAVVVCRQTFYATHRQIIHKQTNDERNA